MTPLMMLALTLPPSLAFVIERWMRGREAQARKLSIDDIRRIDVHGDTLALMRQELNTGAARFAEQGAELKRLNEQLTTLSERVYR